MQKPDTRQVIGQKRGPQDADIYIRNSSKSQAVKLNLNSDDSPFYQDGFCHFLKLKNFNPEILFPDKRITPKQGTALCSIVANCISSPDLKLKIAFHRSNFGKGSTAAESGYGYKPFNDMRHMMEDAGYIKVYAPRSYNTDHHAVSTIHGTPQLFNAISSGVVVKYDPDFFILLKGKVGVNKVRSYIPIENPNAPLLRKIRAIMKPYHSMIGQHDITCNVPQIIVAQVHKAHKDNRKKGDAPQIPDIRFKYPIIIFSDDIKTGGRLYKSWWTGCKREYRQYLRINGERCVELDFSAMHPNILYRLEGYQPQDNIYLFDKSEPPFLGNINRRDVAKVLMLTLINSEPSVSIKSSRRDVINAAREDIRDKRNIKIDYANVKEILMELERMHKPIEKYFYTGAWRICITQEADLIRDIIKAAMARKILVLSVHDSVICQAKHQAEVEAIIRAKTAYHFEVKSFK